VFDEKQKNVLAVTLRKGLDNAKQILPWHRSA
jgi:hypothetical protein